MTHQQHAIVVGGSVAGLLAARALSPFFERVTIVERDRLPSGAVARKGVPQGRHLHGFLAGGVAAIESLLPGFIAEVVARGALAIDVGTFARWHMGGVLIAPVRTGLTGLLLSRPLLEEHLRARVHALGNVQTREHHAVTGLLGDARAITGVRLHDLEPGAPEQELAADYVIDASGRASHVPAWLEALGLPRPREQVVRADVMYTTCTVDRRPEHLDGLPGYVISPTPPSLRSGAALAIEGDRFIVTMTSYLGEHGPRNYGELIAFAESLPFRGLYDLLRTTEPRSELVHYRDVESRRRRFEQLSIFPTGLLLIGDAISHFNPAYGQGVAVAAREARALARCLEQGTHGLWRRYFREAARLIDVPWSMAAAADLQWEGVAGERSPLAPVVSSYLSRVMRAAARDRTAALALYRVMHLIDSPTALCSPSLLARVLWRGRPSASHTRRRGETSAATQA
jgi:2-polyprenyl-6-methoxyphenol hydroxylase-like FAD-dependent oxidoreductase